MNRMRSFPRTAVWIVALLGAVCVPSLFAQEDFEEEAGRSGFYFSAHLPLFSRVAFPATYNAYKSIGGANIPASLALGTTANVNPNAGLGVGVGYQFRFKWLMMSAEAEYAFASASDGEEKLNEDVFYGATFTTVHTQRSFTQTGRKVSVIDLGLNFGVFPFRSFDLGFYVSAGGGYGRQSFNSPAAADAASNGYDINNLRNIDWFDFGDYAGGGTWNRGSFIYFFGLGAEYSISRLISLRLDYKHIASSYSRENVLISSGTVNVYQSKKEYEYTFGNKFSIGLAFHI
jgi:hypothetical protein